MDLFHFALYSTRAQALDVAQLNYFLSTQGQISAVGSIVSSGYGFICGAYMPISSFGNGLQKAVLFLPGTYGTSLLRDHATRGVFEAINDSGIPKEVTHNMANIIDCNLTLGDYTFSEPVKFIIIAASAILLLGAYIAINRFCVKRK